MSRPASEFHIAGDVTGGNIPVDHHPNQPGEFQLIGSEGHTKRIVFGCPLRPGHSCTVPLQQPVGYTGAVWQWDGNREEPTLTPSIHCIKSEASSGCGWHGFIKKGRPVLA